MDGTSKGLIVCMHAIEGLTRTRRWRACAMTGLLGDATRDVIVRHARTAVRRAGARATTTVVARSTERVATEIALIREQKADGHGVTVAVCRFTKAATARAAA